jgi:hypothetical protein
MQHIRGMLCNASIKSLLPWGWAIYLAHENRPLGDAQALHKRQGLRMVL